MHIIIKLNDEIKSWSFLEFTVNEILNNATNFISNLNKEVSDNNELTIIDSYDEDSNILNIYIEPKKIKNLILYDNINISQLENHILNLNDVIFVEIISANQDNLNSYNKKGSLQSSKQSYNNKMKGTGVCNNRSNLSVENLSNNKLLKTNKETNNKDFTPYLKLNNYQKIVLAKIKELEIEETYYVGGFVRDRLMGLNPGDVDFAVCKVSFQELLDKAKSIGLQAEILEVNGQKVGIRAWHPSFVSDNPKEGAIEIALARTEKSTGNGYHDFEIVPDKSIGIQEDLLRRDFTVNAIAVNIYNNKIIDPTNGVDDLKNNLIKTVSPNSFRDDPLRILRGLARVAKNDFEIDKECESQMKKFAKEITSIDNQGKQSISNERIFEELDEILQYPNAYKALQYGIKNDVLKYALPNFNKTINFDQQSKYHNLTCDQHIMQVVKYSVENNYPQTVRWAALLHDIGKPSTAWIGLTGNKHFYFRKNGKFVKYNNENYLLSNEAVIKSDKVILAPNQEYLIGAELTKTPYGHEYQGAILARETLEKLKADKKLIHKVELLVKYHMYKEDDEADSILKSGNNKKIAKLELRARKLIHKVGRDNINELLLLRRCDRMGKSLNTDSSVLKDAIAFEEIIEKQISKALTVKELEINGHDLMSLGFKGKEIGDKLNEFLDKIILNPEYNNKNQLLNWAKKAANK